MTTQKIKELVLKSYKKDMLDIKKVKTFSEMLNRKDLKQYLRMLKNIEKQKTVTIWSASPLSGKEKAKLTSKFKNKKMVFIVDANLGLGVKIVDNDVISDFSLKNELEEMVSYITL